jgi:hypothetical protein
MVGRDGFNEHGIVVCGNLLVSNEDKGKVGVPIPILRRRILHSRHYYEAIDSLVRSPRGASGNYLIAHRDGVAIDFETTPNNVYMVYPERGLLTHANHFQSPVAQATGVGQVLHRRQPVSRLSRAPAARAQDRLDHHRRHQGGAARRVRRAALDLPLPARVSGTRRHHDHRLADFRPAQRSDVRRRRAADRGPNTSRCACRKSRR